MIPISQLVENQRRFFAGGGTIPLAARKASLERLEAAIRAREPQLNAALKADLGKSSLEAYLCETGMTLAELRYQLKHLSRWAKPHRRPTPLASFPARSFTMAEPYGVCLIMSPWNYPFMLCMEPLAGAVAAGNCCVLKPSAYAPETSRAIGEIVAAAFPPEYVAVVQGGRAENAALLGERFDYIFFTGGESVGRLVLEKASVHLTPVSLELGGKSPCIVEASADLALAARRIAFGKYLNCGQTCVAPDYLLIDETVKDAFLPLFKNAVADMYGPEPLANPDYGRIVNRKHFDRLLGLMDPAKVVYGGKTEPEALRISPTVMDGVTPEDPVMQEEIFGPILPILTYRTLQEAEVFIRSREKPLALYLFTRSQAAEERFLRYVSFGGGCINDTILHLATSEMGFGGVGRSGMGAYHGKKSFDTFSHEKSILKKAPWPDLPVRYQPYTKAKESLARRFLK